MRIDARAITSVLVCGLVCLLAGACNALLGNEPPTLDPADASARSEATTPSTDANAQPGPDATSLAEAGTAGDAAPPPILGVERNYFVGETKVTQVNTDLSTVSIIAHVLQPDGGTTDYPGVGRGDGTFEIDGVSVGAEYYVKLPASFPGSPWPLFAYSTSRKVDASEFLAGRPNVAFTDPGAGDASSVLTTVDYNLTGIVAPSADGYGVYVASWGAQAFWVSGNPSTGNFTTTVSPTLTSLTGADLFFAGTPLVDPTFGDTTLVSVFEYQDAGIDPNEYPPQAVTQVYRTGAFAMTQGGTEALDASVETLDAATAADGGAIYFTWDRGAFLAATGDMSLSNTAWMADVAILAAPGFAPGGGQPASLRPFAYSYSLYGTPANDPAKEPLTPRYGDPFPSNWTRYVQADVMVHNSIQYPLPDGGTLSTSVGGFLLCQWLLEDAIGQTLAPSLSAPKSVEVNGHPASSPVTGVGLEPVVSWAAPALGAPTSYYLAVKEVTLGAGAPRVVVTMVAGISTTPDITQVRLPSGLLHPGHHYVFSLSARASADGKDAPELSAPPSCLTNATTAVATP